MPPQVSQVIARAIARDRDDRYGSAMGSARRASPRVQDTFIQRHRADLDIDVAHRSTILRAWPIVLLVVASWAVLLGLGRSSRTPAPANPIPIVAVLPFANNSTPDDVPLAAGMRDVLIANLGAPRHQRVVEGRGQRGHARPRRSQEARQGSRRHPSDRRKPAAIGQRPEGLDQPGERRDRARGVEQFILRAGEGDLLAAGTNRRRIGRAGPIGTSGTTQSRDSKLGTNDVEALSRYGQAVEAPSVPTSPAIFSERQVSERPSNAIRTSHSPSRGWATRIGRPTSRRANRNGRPMP